MKLRTKLFVALAAALVFQLVQVLVTEHYIRRMAGAAERIDEAVTASECGRAAIDALQAARAAIGEVSRHQRPLPQLHRSPHSAACGARARNSPTCAA